MWDHLPPFIVDRQTLHDMFDDGLIAGVALVYCLIVLIALSRILA